MMSAIGPIAWSVMYAVSKIFLSSFAGNGSGLALPGLVSTILIPGASLRQLLVDLLEDVREDAPLVDPDVEVCGVEPLDRVVLRAGLAEEPADDLLDLDVRLHALVDVAEVGERVVPALLEAEVEDHVAEVASDEVRVVLVAALEEPEVGRQRVVLVRLEREVDRDGGGVDAALLGQVAPDQDGRRATLKERLLGVVHLQAVALDDVRLADVDRLGRSHAMGRGLLLGVVHVRDQRVDRLLHRRLIAAELDAALDEPGVGDRLGVDVGDQFLVGPALLLERLDLVAELRRQLHRCARGDQGVGLQLEEQVHLLIGEVVAPRRTRAEAAGGCPRRRRGASARSRCSPRPCRSHS